VLLLILCWLNYDAGRQAREERNQFRQTYEAMAGKADSSAIRAHGIAARALEREIQTAKVVEDNTRVLRRVERRLPKARVENEEG
jgi:hypothetical protein